MTLLAKVLQWVVVVLACGCLSGCFLSGQSQMDEQKEPHFLDGKRRQNALDYKGAIESFDKALQVNPNSDLPGERSEEHTSELQSQSNLVCRLLLEKKKTNL